MSGTDPVRLVENRSVQRSVLVGVGLLTRNVDLWTFQNNEIVEEVDSGADWRKNNGKFSSDLVRCGAVRCYPPMNAASWRRILDLET